MRTFIKAIKILKTGNETAAWEIAKLDEGLNKSVKKSEWLAYAYNSECFKNSTPIKSRVHKNLIPCFEQ